MARALNRIDYDRSAACYEKHRGSSPRLAAEILTRLGEPPRPASVLDVGAGPGKLASALRELGARVVCADLSREMARLARSRGLECVRADAGRLPFADRSFDLVVLTYVLQHIPEWRSAVEECARVAKTCVTAVTASARQIRGHVFARFFPSFAPADLARFPRIEELLACGEALGFEAEASEVMTSGVEFGPEYLERVRSKHVSTLELISEEEFRQGLEAIEKHMLRQQTHPTRFHLGTLITFKRR